jgi:5-methylcytosine-specific restriction endonuclease McrA
MQAFRPADLTTDEIAHLRKKTQKLLREPVEPPTTPPTDRDRSYAGQVKWADKWSSKGLKGAKKKLMDARPGDSKCVFCELDTGREVEHVRPRTLYPHLTWDWANLVCACGDCNNGYKGVRDAILDVASPGAWIETTLVRKKNDPVVPPTAGDSAWLNPRAWNPLDSLKLDILGESFEFMITATTGTPEYARASWTLEALKLNKRVALVNGRKNAFRGFRRWLKNVVEKRTEPAELGELKEELRTMHHPTVWAEMKRQRADLPEINALFEQVPEVLNW